MATGPDQTVISAFLATKEGRIALAQSMARPLRGRHSKAAPCPVCGAWTTDVVVHAKNNPDPEHEVLEVMES